MALKEEFLALSSGVYLASCAVGYLDEHASIAFEDFKEEIIDSIVRPKKRTALHVYLDSFGSMADHLRDAKEGDLEKDFKLVTELLKEVNLEAELPELNLDSCAEDCQHDGCECDKILDQYFDYVYEHSSVIDARIVQAAFQILFQDRQFLRKFHLELARFIEKNMDAIRERHSDHVTQRGYIKRRPFPVWLKTAVFHRDKGTCTFCRRDLTHLVRPQNIKHIDHIVPLALYGSNDASNFQLLCETCNTSKGARSTKTSAVNVPFWNLD
ncbi:HNH endonuclease [Bacillus sp. AR8-1]|uniref:HNH endonuclease n=1 Tax=Bacillus sp. AR8-1 TaxID=2217826 RepID=UPI0011CA4678|nr:HNH endonuclease [Bacillus sp. AR8-1]TXR66492.1 HNH endonuclease [Bacillus sp. AR8-1]